jgi:hypothetical protein
MDLIVAFRLFVRTLPIHFALLGQKQKYIKSKTTAKLKEKRTSIAAVRDILRVFDTFPNPLLSHCRLPLKVLSSLKRGGSRGIHLNLYDFVYNRKCILGTLQGLLFCLKSQKPITALSGKKNGVLFYVMCAAKT